MFVYFERERERERERGREGGREGESMHEWEKGRVRRRGESQMGSTMSA